MHSVLENSNIGPTDSLNCVRLQDSFPQNFFSKISTFYPSIGSGGTPNIPGGERVIANRGHTEDLIFLPETAFTATCFLYPKREDLYASGDRLKFFLNEHFQMENLRCLKALLLPGDFMTNIVLKDAYLSVLVHESSESSFASFGREHVTSSKPVQCLRKF